MCFSNDSGGVFVAQEKSSVMFNGYNLKLGTLSKAMPFISTALRSILIVFLISTTISFVFLVLRIRLLVEHQAFRFCILSGVHLQIFPSLWSLDARTLEMTILKAK